MARTLRMWKYPTFKEGHARSVTRSVVWRAFGVLFLAFVTYMYTQNWITTGLVTVVHHTSFILIYYLHERFWLKTDWLKQSRWKPFMRVVTYEVILGNLVLGVISYAFTGHLQTMTLITLTYISNKYWMFYAYDWIWSRTKWQTKKY